jgi:hypothetical protein
MPSDHQPWRIYFCPRCENAEPDPKNKLVVVLCTDPEILGVFVNTKSSPWLQKRSLEMCETGITAGDHPALQYDSFVDCHSVYEFNDFELTQDKGAVSEEAKVHLLKAVQECPTIIRRHRKLILGQAGIALDDDQS